MPTLKQRYNRIVKRIWNPRVYDYPGNFRRSLIRSTKLGLSYNKNFEQRKFEFSKEEKEHIVSFTLTAMYYIDKLEMTDVTMKCFIVSNHLQAFLLKHFNINSIVTTGNLYLNKRRYYYESISSLEKRLNDNSYHPNFAGHSWLTLENFDIIDIGLIPNMWAEDMSKGIVKPVENYKRIWWSDTSNENKNAFVYEPLLVGFEYFEKIRLPLTLHAVTS